MSSTSAQHALSHFQRRRSAFSLVELVMVVTIIGIVSGIAVPRMADASSRASANALQATLANVRKAIDVYYAEHGLFPGYDPASRAAVSDRFTDQLVMYSDEQGRTTANYGYPYIFGPYLRAPFPKNPTNDLATVHMKTNPGDVDPADGTVGWVAVLSTGDFQISAKDSDLTRFRLTKEDLR